MLSFDLWYQVLEDDEDMAMMYLTMYQEVKQTVLRQQSRDITLQQADEPPPMLKFRTLSSGVDVPIMGESGGRLEQTGSLKPVSSADHDEVEVCFSKTKTHRRINSFFAHTHGSGH